ncbi:MAG: N-acetyltransferase [Calditrichaeota bacterium]|nr:MAG: N-acetyltransferase [Calditrichota bacterium]
MKAPVFESTRFRLIPFTKSESKIFHEINTDKFVRKFLWDNESITLSLAKEMLMRNERYFLDDKFGLWKIILNNTEIIGYAGLWYFFNEPQPQLIYVLLKDYTGKGYATEASKIIINYAFTKLQFQYLVAAIDEPNITSQKVAERLGMKFFRTKKINNNPLLFYRIDKINTR